MSLFLILALLLSDTQVLGKTSIPTPWGWLEAGDESAGIYLAQIARMPKDRCLLLPADMPPLAAAHQIEGWERTPLSFEFSSDAKELRLCLPEDDASPMADRVIVLEVADKSIQRSDGRNVFCASDAKIAGTTARLESRRGHRRIEFGTDASASASWDYKAKRPGMYDVEITYSLTGGSESQVEATLADAAVSAPLTSTNSQLRYKSLRLGQLYLPKPGEHQLKIRSTNSSGKVAFNLLAVTLRPACEGKPIVQAEDGSVTCHARDVTIHGVQVQYEPKPEKSTVGFWTIPSDRVTWDFTFNAPGQFDVEILQGCGKGQGGSEVELSVDGQPLRFVVEDTGHFQNFVPRTIGQVKLDRPGRYEILVKPLRKAGVAVMDLRQVRLVPRN
jgi:hypothetical protein